MVAKRGPGSRGMGPKRASAKGKAIKQESKKKKSQQALRLTKAKTGGSAVVVGRTKSTDDQGASNMAVINQEALVELNEHLLANPQKILVVLRMAKKDSFFRESSQLPNDWLHPTLIYLKNAGKQNWREALLCYSEKKQLGWTMELLTKMDKANELHGIEMVASYLGHLDFNDYLPKRLHYKPLFKVVLAEHFMATGKGNVTIDKHSGELKISKSIYELSDFDASQNKYKTITHVSSATKVDISEDLHVTAKWKVNDAWSWSQATLAGQRASENIYTLFQDAGLGNKIDYDTDTFLDAATDRIFKACPELAKEVGVAEKVLDDALMEMTPPTKTAKSPLGSPTPDVK